MNTTTNSLSSGISSTSINKTSKFPQSGSNLNTTQKKTQRGVNSKLHRFLVLIRISITVIILIQAIILLKTTLNDLKVEIKAQNDNLKFLNRNWKSPHLVDIISSNKPCSELKPENQDIEYHFFNYTWPGSKDSCDCRKSDTYSLEKKNLERKVYWQECDADMQYCSCKGTKGLEPVKMEDFYFFDSALKKKSNEIVYRVCLKMDKSVNYADQVNLRTELKKCKKGYILHLI